MIAHKREIFEYLKKGLLQTEYLPIIPVGPLGPTRTPLLP